MVYERDSGSIVMLSGIIEGDKVSVSEWNILLSTHRYIHSGPYSLYNVIYIMQEVCVKYWPSSGMQQYGEYAVSVLEESMLEGHLERVFSVTDSKVQCDFIV